MESVEITVAEDLGVEHRGAYYQEAGALRDMVQNHLTQLLTVVGMEVPTSFEASEVRAEKLKVLRSISPILSQDVIFGQYTAWDVAGQRIARLSGRTRCLSGLDHRDVCGAEVGGSQLALEGSAVLLKNRETASAQNYASGRHLPCGAHSSLSIVGAG